MKKTSKAKALSETPILTDFLYDYTSIPEIIIHYQEALRNTNSMANKFHAIKLEEYRQLITDRASVDVIRKSFSKVYSLLDTNFPEISFYLEGRRKSLISTERKILLYLDEKRSLHEFRDMLAFRIIVLEDNSEELISTCYKIMEQLIEFYIENGFMPVEATHTFQTDGFKNDGSIVVPEKSLLRKDLLPYVKDYTLNPKESGYQSLHTVFEDPSGRNFELQIRTIAQHLHAEASDSAGHDIYKESRYKNEVINFEPEKIKIKNYAHISDEMVFDYVGLERPFQIMQRQKTFFKDFC